MSKIKEALIRGGHQHPEQILADLEAGGCIVLDPQEAADYNDLLGDLTLREYSSLRYGLGYNAGYEKGLDVGKDRFS